MKCTCCGNTNLKKLNDNDPFWVDCGYDGSGALRSNNCDIYICTSCGHYEFFNLAYIEKHNEMIRETKQYNDSMMELISDLEGKKNALLNTEFNPEPYEKQIEKLENEIKTLKSLSVSGRDLESREEAIAYNKKILEAKMEPAIQSQVQNIECQIAKMRKKLK